MSWHLIAPAIVDGLVKLGMEYFKEDSNTQQRNLVPTTKRIKVTVLASLEVEANSLQEAKAKIESVASTAGVEILEVEET